MSVILFVLEIYLAWKQIKNKREKKNRREISIVSILLNS